MPSSHFTRQGIEKRTATFKAVIKEGVRATSLLCQTWQDALPPPGGPVAALLGQVVMLVDTAMANHDNLKALQERAAELMDVIIEKHVSKVDQAADQGGSKATKAGSRLYCQLMARFRDLLDGILAYTNEYCNRKFFMKLLMTSQCREQYQELVEDLAKLLASAHFSVSVDTHFMVADVRSMTAEMKGMVEDIRRRTQYTDRSSEVKHLVDELGGYDAVANSDAKLDEVVKHLDSGQQIEIAVLKKQAHAGLMALEAAQEQGAHRLVKHTDMRTFWRMCFKGLPKVDWEVWWEAFPSQLMAVVPDKAVVEQVTALLSTEADLWQFQKAVEKNDGETISVKEVNDTFPSYMSIPKAVGRALGLREDGASEATAISGSPEAEVLYRESLASACLESQGKEEPKTLKDAPTMYSGQVQPSAARHPKMAVEKVAAEIPPMETGPCICEAGRLVNLGGRPVPKHCRPACNVKNPVGEEEGMPGTQFGWALQQQLQGGRVMNGRLADRVEVQPPDLRFRLVLGKQLLATISINNPLEKCVAFKILIKAPKKYVVRPVSGIAEAHSQVNMQVIMQAQQEYPPDFQNCRDKFKIQVTPLESMETLNKDTFNKEMRTDMWEHLLCVIMESPAALPSRVKQEQKDLHQELGEGEFVLRATAEPLPIIHDGRPRWQNEVQAAECPWEQLEAAEARAAAAECKMAEEANRQEMVRKVQHAQQEEAADAARSQQHQQQQRQMQLLSSPTWSTTFTKNEDPISSVTFTPDGSMLVSGVAGYSEDGNTIKLWDLASGNCRAVLRGHSDLVRSVAVSRDGRMMVSGSDDKTVRVWDLGSRKCTATHTDHTNAVKCVAVSPDGATIASVGGDETVRLWGTRPGSSVVTLSGDYGGLLCVAFNLDGTHLATGGYDQTVRVWDLRRIWDEDEDPCIAKLQGHGWGVESVIFSQDGATVLSGSRDKSIKVWDVESGRCERTLKGHKDAVLTLALTADGQQAVSGSGDAFFFNSDTTIKIWDWRNSGNCLATLKGHKNDVSSVAVSPDGKTLASGSKDQTIRLWKLAQ